MGATAMIDEAEFEKSLILFREAVGYVVSAFKSDFPEGVEPGDREAMARLGSRVEDLIMVYDRLQAAAGLQEGERPRFAKFFIGREGVYTEVPPWHQPDVR
jgi:hypothetical protein